MKRKLLPYLILPLFFTSCVFVSQSDDSRYEKKVSYKTFESVKDPIVFAYDYNLDFALYGNKNLDSSTIYHGNILMIYDWENEKVHDYVYAPGTIGDVGPKKIVPGCKTGGTAKFYSADYDYKTVYELDASKTELKKIPLDEKNRFSENGWGDIRNINSETLIRYHLKSFDEETMEQEIKLCILDPSKSTFNNPLSVNIDSIYALKLAYSESEKDYWMTYDTKADKANKSYATLRKVNVSENKIEEEFLRFDRNEGKTYDEIDGWNGTYSYEILGVNSNYLILKKSLFVYESKDSEAECIVAVNKNDKSLKNISVEMGEGFSIIDSAVIEDTVYIICTDSVSAPSKLNIFKINPAADSSAVLLKKFDCESGYYVFVRENRIYFTKHDSSDNSFTIFYFNTTDSSISEAKSIKFTDFAE